MKKKEKILLISIDSLRADHLGCYGYFRNTSPTIDTLAEESYLFEYPFSASSYTGPSFSSLFTSKYPSFNSNGFRNWDLHPVEFKEILLQEILQDHGFTTAAYVSNLILSRKLMRLDRGFDVYDDNLPLAELNRPEMLYRSGEDTVSQALSFIKEKKDNNFFVWVHLMDTHGPYYLTEPYQNLFIEDEYWSKPPVLLHRIEMTSELENITETYIPGIFDYQLLKKEFIEDNKMISYERNVDYYVSQYDAAIRYVDDQVKRIIRYLKELGIFEDCVIIIHSDHGEAFGENNIYFFHGLTVTLDQIHVPLIIKIPGEQGRRVSHPVSLIDIMPTILDMNQIQWDRQDSQGVSLFDEDKVRGRIIYSQAVKQLSAIQANYQFLYGKGWLERLQGNLFWKDIDPQKRWDYRVIRVDSGIDVSALLDEKIKHVLYENARKFIDAANNCPVTEKVSQTKQEEESTIRKHLSMLGYID